MDNFFIMKEPIYIRLTNKEGSGAGFASSQIIEEVTEIEIEDIRKMTSQSNRVWIKI